MVSFAAKYPDTCHSDECANGAIDVGDEVEYRGDELVHVGCASRERRQANDPYCDDCGLHHRREC